MHHELFIPISIKIGVHNWRSTGAALPRVRISINGRQFYMNLDTDSQNLIYRFFHQYIANDSTASLSIQKPIKYTLTFHALRFEEC